MTLLASILDQNVLSMLPEPVIKEWNDQLRNLDRKLSNAIVQLKTEDSIIKKEKTQLHAMVKALTEENEKLKIELATGSAVSVVKNVEHLLKGLETRLNQSNITLGESINKKLLNNISMMQQHTNVTKITHKSVVASMEVINARLKDSMDRLNSLHCMQMLSDPSTGSVAYGEVS
ncbi:Protein of unknown function [Pyronema omphalodes CBS 100304]|uniref:Uncharacterized protein n=1 Tax=Pyronema omphalodes (strain CBS 100304) TaxID=1076935 RepID=U4KTX6_PYROM|nr:Protein of unknown function [Pyronema omphalodes CBS 100304]